MALDDLMELASVCFQAGIAHGQGAKNDWSTDGKAWAIIDRITAAATRAGEPAAEHEVAAKDGWALVPVTPTAEMTQAAYEAAGQDPTMRSHRTRALAAFDMRRMWDAMLRSAPLPEQTEAQRLETDLTTACKACVGRGWVVRDATKTEGLAGFVKRLEAERQAKAARVAGLAPGSCPECEGVGYFEGAQRFIECDRCNGTGRIEGTPDQPTDGSKP